MADGFGVSPAAAYARIVSLTQGFDSMRIPWRTSSDFVTSTFRDMHAARHGPDRTAWSAM